jgi:hypothetical protein
MVEEMSAITEKDTSDVFLKVEPIEGFRFLEQSNIHHDSIVLEPGEWVENSGNLPIEMNGAEPCLIIYARHKKTGRMMAGHFPDADEDKVNYFVKDELEYGKERVARNYKDQDADSLVIPFAPDINRFSKDPVSKFYRAYQDMIQRLGEVVQDAPDDYEIYLFGQNTGKYIESDTLGDRAMTQFGVTQDLLDAGVLQGHIRDYRTVGVNKVDSTLFLPSEQKIYNYVDVRD